jgi:arylsulfatase
MKKPNILLIMCDQLRADSLASYGNPLVQAPHMNRIAEQGVTFERAYSRTPVCVPARYGLMSGKAPFRLGLTDNNNKLKPIQNPLPELLKLSGYFTCAVGKMHFSPVRAHYGFDRMYLSEEIPGHFADDDYLQFLNKQGRLDVVEPHGKRSDSYYVPQTSELPEELHTSAWTAQQTCEVIRENRDRPFFIFTSFIKPHPPFDPCAPYDTMYDPATVPMPIRNDAELDPIDLSIDTQNDYKVNGIRKVSDDEARRIRAAYYGCITQTDAQIGRILDQLEALNLTENTLVILTSDHGEMLGDHYSFGKRTFYEASNRVPLILSWPAGLPRGERRQQFAVLEDIYATALSVAGVGIPTDSCGVNLLPSAMDANGVTHTEVHGEFGRGPMLKFMLRWEDYKYIYHTNGGREALFDLRSDPNELQNISVNHAALCDECHRKIKVYYEVHGFDEALEGDALKHYEPHQHEPRGYLNQAPRWQSTVFD